MLQSVATVVAATACAGACFCWCPTAHADTHTRTHTRTWSRSTMRASTHAHWAHLLLPHDARTLLRPMATACLRECTGTRARPDRMRRALNSAVIRCMTAVAHCRGGSRAAAISATSSASKLGRRPRPRRGSPARGFELASDPASPTGVPPGLATGVPTGLATGVPPGLATVATGVAADLVRGLARGLEPALLAGFARAVVRAVVRGVVRVLARGLAGARRPRDGEDVRAGDVVRGIVSVHLKPGGGACVFNLFQCCLMTNPRAPLLSAPSWTRRCDASL